MVVRPRRTEKSRNCQFEARTLVFPEISAGAWAPGSKPNQLAMSPARGALKSKAISGPVVFVTGAIEPLIRALTSPERIRKSRGLCACNIIGSSAPADRLAENGWSSSVPRMSPERLLPEGKRTANFSRVKRTGSAPSALP